MKGLKAQIEKKKVLKGKVDVKKSQIEVFKKDNKPKDLAKERDILEKKKLKFVAEDVGLAVKLTKNLTDARNVRQKIDLCQTASGVFHKVEQRLRNEISEEKEELDKVKERLGEQEEISRHASDVYAKQLSSARNITGDNYKGKNPVATLTSFRKLLCS